jgi:uncharacterized protein DUF4314
MRKVHVFDFALQGRRIRLICINDRYTDLKPGSMGTIEYCFENLDTHCIAVKWDSGSRVSMIEGVDEYAIMKGEKVFKF